MSPSLRSLLDRLQRFLPDVRLLACLLLGAAVYAPTVVGEFVWDDIIFIGRWAGNTDTWREILFPKPDVLGTRYYYRPITQGFATLLWSLFGQDDPTWWHASIILVHVVTIAVVFVLLREWWLAPSDDHPEAEGDLRIREWAAVAGAAFYACWPANAESVAWISSRADTLLGPFLIGAIVLHLRARDRGRRPIGASVLFFCSLLVKETGVVFLPMAIACTVLLPRGMSARPTAPDSRVYDHRKFWAPALWLPHLLVYFLYSWMRKKSMGPGSGLTEVATMLVERLDPIRVVRAWGFYVQEALSLGDAPPFLQHPPSTTSVLVFGAFGIVAFAVACALLLRRRTWPIALAAAWFVLPLGPPLATVSTPLSQNSVTVHYLYIPNVALAALVGLLAFVLLRKPWFARLRKPALAAALVLCGLFGVQAYRNYQPWMSGVGLWSRAAIDNPNSCLAQHNLGVAYWVSDQFDAARVHLRIAGYGCKPLDSPERHSGLVALAQFYMSQEEYGLARTALRESRRLSGSKFMLGRGMEIEAALLLFETLGPKAAEGAVDVRREDLRRTMAALEDAALIDRSAPAPRVSLGLLYLSVGERARALRSFRDALRVASTQGTRALAKRQIEQIEADIAAEPDPIRRAYERGQIAEDEGRTGDAIAAYREALAAAPERTDIRLAVADLLARSGDLPAAIVEARIATESDAKSAICWLNLGVYQGSSGDVANAEQAFARARELAPGWPKACANHGLALETLSRPVEAAEAYESCLGRIPAADLESRRLLERSLAKVRATQSVAP